MDFKNLDLIDAIEKVVDSMRTTGVYTSVYSEPFTTLTVENDLNNYDTVIINGISYIVTNATASSFKVRADVTGFSTYKTAAPYFEYGHILEVANTLAKKDNSTQKLSFQKYPLIVLPLDVASRYNKALNTFDYENVNILIVNKTKQTYTAKDRKVNNFEPILIPLYESFIKALKQNSYVNNSNNVPFIDHLKYDRYFWGAQLNNNSTKNIFNDFLDAIEIRELNIKINNINC